MAPLYSRYVPPKNSKPSAPSQSKDPPRPKTQAIAPPATPDINANTRPSNGLYARYVPPKLNVDKPEKRRRHENQPDATAARVDEDGAQASTNGVNSTAPETRSKKRMKVAHSPSIDDLRDQPNSAKLFESPPKAEKTRKSKKGGGELLVQKPEDNVFREAESNNAISEKSRRKKKRKEADAPDVASPAEAEERSKSHTDILARYAKSAVRPSTPDQVEDEPQDQEAPEINQLLPIPLPPSPDHGAARPWSALPSWYANPQIVAPDASIPFSSMGLSKTSMGKLRKLEFRASLPVQAGVLPLLLPTPAQHPGDLCVSAATGSGKTLSYVLPIVEDLEQLDHHLLRAVIIVPTRELVAQVRETCESLVNGSALAVKTAVGNQSLKEEQTELFERYMRYDPAGHAPIHRKLSRPLDDEEPDRSDEEEIDDLLGINEDLLHVLPDHVPAYRPKVDILIATPGRLVEHIRNTCGFSFAYLKWLVIDEADRLLDQSFQEWADIVSRALDFEPPEMSANSFEGNPLLKGLFGSNRKAPAKKVVLSATMTSSLDKLTLLRLRNPKLLVVQGSDPTMGDDAAAAKGEQTPIAGILTLPLSLEEWAVPVGDGSEKPLYLLSLLEKILGEHGPDPSQTANPSKGPASPHVPHIESNTDNDSDSDASSGSSSSVSSIVSSTSSSDPSDTSSPAAPDAAKPAVATVLVFTSTTESTSRLHALLAHMAPHLAAHTGSLTRGTSAAQTARLLSRLRSGALRVLIASDRASRGLDVPQLTHVVSYDVPSSVTSYVHRVGRTARAGRAGAAWTLTERKEAGWFWHVVARGDADKTAKRAREDVRISRGGGQKVRKIRLEGVGEGGARERYEDALGKLKEDVQARRP